MLKLLNGICKELLGIVDREEDVDRKKASDNNKISAEDFQKLRTQIKD
jgi:hypothetical protein